MTELVYTLKESYRLDQYLAKSNPDLSRSYIAKHIANSRILVNGSPAKPSQPLKPGDRINFSDSLLNISQPPTITLPILYEDDFCIVINKPSGVITHAKGAINVEGSVASFIQSRINSELSGNRAGIVHRLDRGTSGVIIAAKTKDAQKYLQRQFAKRQTNKTYLALVTGHMDKQQAIINMPIERNPKHPSTFRVGAGGKPAQTEYKVLSTKGEYSFLKLHPKTGRTHQLRVHLKAINHPIIGDDLYGGVPANRLMLHAYMLEVILPDKGRQIFCAPPPDDFNQYINLDNIKL